MFATVGIVPPGGRRSSLGIKRDFIFCVNNLDHTSCFHSKWFDVIKICIGPEISGHTGTKGAQELRFGRK